MGDVHMSIFAMAEKKAVYCQSNSFEEKKILALSDEFACKTPNNSPEDYVQRTANCLTVLNINGTDCFDNERIPKKMKNLQLSEDAKQIVSTVGREYRRLFHRRRSVTAEAFEPNVEKERHVEVFAKSNEERKRLLQAFEDVFAFKSCTNVQLKILLNAMFEKRVRAGEVIINEGDEGENFYVIDKGIFDVFHVDQGRRTKVGTFYDKGSFGELALMYNCSRSATVMAVTDGILWCLRRSTFKQIIVGTAQEKKQKYEELLQRVPLLSILTHFERMSLADALETQTFKEGQCILREGEEAHCMYFIESGTVRIAVKDNEAGEEKTITFASKDDYFGELALINEAPRAASVFAIEDVTCAVLDVGAFERLLGSCIELMKERLEDYNEQRRRLGVSTITTKSSNK